MEDGFLSWWSVIASGCNAVTCLSLSHTVHLISSLQSLARWVVEPQHLKQTPNSPSNLLRSSRDFILNPKHLLSGCGFLCMGHSLFGSLGSLSPATD
ncbi:hypothetical protein FKM82_024937 [Ascaphus truei]